MLRKMLEQHFSLSRKDGRYSDCGDFRLKLYAMDNCNLLEVESSRVTMERLLFPVFVVRVI